MVVTKISANAFIWGEATIRRPQLDAWWLKRVVSWEGKSAVIDPIFVGAISQTENYKVPLENIVLLGDCDEVCEIGSLQKILELSLKSRCSCHYFK